MSDSKNRTECRISRADVDTAGKLDEAPTGQLGASSVHGATEMRLLFELLLLPAAATVTTLSFRQLSWSGASDAHSEERQVSVDAGPRSSSQPPP